MKKACLLLLLFLVCIAGFCAKTLDVTLDVEDVTSVSWKLDANGLPGDDVPDTGVEFAASDNDGDYSVKVWAVGESNIAGNLDVFIAGSSELSATIDGTSYSIPFSINIDDSFSGTVTSTVEGSVLDSFVLEPDLQEGTYRWSFEIPVTLSASRSDVNKVPATEDKTAYTGSISITVQSAL